MKSRSPRLRRRCIGWRPSIAASSSASRPPDVPQGALRSVLERWGFTLEEDVIATGEVSEHDDAALQLRVDELMEGRLAQVSRSAPPFATALRAHRAALVAGDIALADGILAWIGAQPNVAAAVKRAAGVKGRSTTSAR